MYDATPSGAARGSSGSEAETETRGRARAQPVQISSVRNVGVSALIRNRPHRAGAVLRVGLRIGNEGLLPRQHYTALPAPVSTSCALFQGSDVRRSCAGSLGRSEPRERAAGTVTTRGRWRGCTRWHCRCRTRGDPVRQGEGSGGSSASGSGEACKHRRDVNFPRSRRIHCPSPRTSLRRMDAVMRRVNAKPQPRRTRLKRVMWTEASDVDAACLGSNGELETALNLE